MDKEKIIKGLSLAAGLVMTAAALLAAVFSMFTLPSFAHISSELPSLSYADEFDSGMHNISGDILRDVFFVKTRYVIPETALAAPEPSPECYGVNNDGSIELIMSDAVLKGLAAESDYIYSPDVSNWLSQPAEYYYDDTILSILWKERIDDCVVNFAEICIADASQFRHKLSGDSYGSGIQMTTSAMSESTNAVVGMSGDFYSYRSYGCTVYQRQVYRCNVSNLDVCFINSNGDFVMKHYPKFMKAEEIQRFVDENDILFSLSFGPVLIENGELQPINEDYILGQPAGNYARAAIAQIGPLHYLLCTIDGGVDNLHGTTVEHMAKILYDKGCPNAYAMDGGQTATIYFNGRVFNRVGYGSERDISDIIYFGTAIDG